jgi:hypothetical protein
MSLDRKLLKLRVPLASFMTQNKYIVLLQLFFFFEGLGGDGRMYSSLAGSWHMYSLLPIDSGKLVYHWDVKCSVQIA